MVEIEKKEYDGITEVYRSDGIKITSFNIHDALDQKNPRNVFLNGQLYLEDSVDMIISWYFGYDNNIRHASIINFLKSGHCDFFTKVEFLSMLINKYRQVPNSLHQTDHFISDRRIIASLRIIGQVRNAFQHNLVADKAFIEASKEGAKFKLTDKRLDTCKNVDELVNLFKEEAFLLYDKLHEMILTEMPHSKIDLKTLIKYPLNIKLD